LRRYVDPPIGKTLAEIALIAEIPGGWPALRRNIGPMLIGELNCTPLVRQQNNGQWVDH